VTLQCPLFFFQLLPLYFCIGLGGCGAFLYTLRLATRSPDVSWLNKKEAEPWNDYKDKQYKVYNVTVALCCSKPTLDDSQFVSEFKIESIILFYAL